MWRKVAARGVWAVLGAAVFGIIGNQSNDVFVILTGGVRELMRPSIEHPKMASNTKGYDDTWTNSDLTPLYDHGSGSGLNKRKYDSGWSTGSDEPYYSDGPDRR